MVTKAHSVEVEVNTDAPASAPPSGTAADAPPAGVTRVKTLVTSTPPSHTINRAKLAGIDVGLQLCHTHLLMDSACLLRLIQGYM
jgi:hypothetical protein